MFKVLLAIRFNHIGLFKMLKAGFYQKICPRYNAYFNQLLLKSYFISDCNCQCIQQAVRYRTIYV